MAPTTNLVSEGKRAKAPEPPANRIGSSPTKADGRTGAADEIRNQPSPRQGTTTRKHHPEPREILSATSLCQGRSPRPGGTCLRRSPLTSPINADEATEVPPQLCPHDPAATLGADPRSHCTERVDASKAIKPSPPPWGGAAACPHRRSEQQHRDHGPRDRSAVAASRKNPTRDMTTKTSTTIPGNTGSRSDTSPAGPHKAQDASLRPDDG